METPGSRNAGPRPCAVDCLEGIQLRLALVVVDSRHKVDQRHQHAQRSIRGVERSHQLSLRHTATGLLLARLDPLANVGLAGVHVKNANAISWIALAQSGEDFGEPFSVLQRPIDPNVLTGVERNFLRDLLRCVGMQALPCQTDN
jgi:hypothetical protein